MIPEEDATPGQSDQAAQLFRLWLQSDGFSHARGTGACSTTVSQQVQPGDNRSRRKLSTRVESLSPRTGCGNVPHEEKDLWR